MQKSLEERGPLQAVLSAKCPRCREGKMFEHHPYALRHLASMNETCPNCGLRFELEPGFFYGAMYVSYAVSVAILITTIFILYFIAGDPSLTTYIVSVVIASLVLYPINFRYSRVLFLHVFGGVKYEASKNNDLSS